MVMRNVWIVIKKRSEWLLKKIQFISIVVMLGY